ncbi:MAG: protein-L-isoaspartate(D-aspartate) O-methyltransferase [Draconibacterium sp.]
MRSKIFVIYIHCATIFLTMTVCGQKNDFNSERSLMVKTQIQARGIVNNKILNAFRTVPRHEFVLPEYLHYAYNDQPLPIEEGQTISQPFIVAYMTDALQLKKSDRVLEIGTGSGYQAAILAQLCDSVFTIEIFGSLAGKAQKLFEKLQYNNIVCKTADGYLGWEEKAPFDAIIVTCAPSQIPQPLQKQLANGGKMIIPLGEGRVQHLVLLQKQNDKIRQKSVLPVRFVPMIDAAGIKY